MEEPTLSPCLYKVEVHFHSVNIELAGILKESQVVTPISGVSTPIWLTKVLNPAHLYWLCLYAEN